VREVYDELVEAAAGKDIWVCGGGELAGRFADAGLLDQVWVQDAPVTLGAGAPFLPRHVELRLAELAQNRDFVCARYDVIRARAAPDGTIAT
jgi:dihydrofolate reductase